MQLDPTLRLFAMGLFVALLVPIGTSCDGDTGSGGSAGGNTGGSTGGSAGSGTGGSAGGTTTATGGSSTCADICPAVVAAACAKGPPDVASCETGCAAVMSSCGAEFNALLQCGGANPTFVCDADGNPYPTGCEAENAALVACTSGVPSVCAEMCPAVVAAACPAGPPDEASCEGGCADGKVKCPTEFAALEQCVPASPTADCDANGSPYVNGCQAETLALLMCIAM
jgi:hypothetical protein